MLKLEPTLDLIAGEPEPQLSENALRVLEKRYLKKDEAGKVIETPRELFWRVSWNLAQADAYYGATEAQVAERARTFYRMLASLEFLPNSPTLMNAGLDLQQLSACFVLPVEDSLSGIFQTLKESALIHQSGGGCVAADSHVFTTFCGIERIETLYERVRGLGVTEDVRPGHRVLDVSHLSLRTLAVDPASGAFAAKQVTHLWRWDVPGDEQYRIRCSGGTEVTTSAWHPFFVLTESGIAERRADALRPGDVLLSPNRSVRQVWPFTKYIEQEGFVVNERLAWLVGFFLGDGSLGRFHNRVNGYRALRLRFFDGRPENIQFAREVLADHGVSITPQRDGRGLWSITTTDSEIVPRFARLAQVEPGPKWLSDSYLSSARSDSIRRCGRSRRARGLSSWSIEFTWGTRRGRPSSSNSSAIGFTIHSVGNVSDSSRNGLPTTRTPGFPCPSLSWRSCWAPPEFKRGAPRFTGLPLVLVMRGSGSTTRSGVTESARTSSVDWSPR
ncbi:MAG: hypothetical protein E6K13_08150 [Methanobacteriota archaeon]|nr:MAG: hypothetical protein E6K13_08150 [Euryarchaeota archaeon]